MNQGMSHSLQRNMNNGVKVFEEREDEECKDFEQDL